jgi:hypothetical protein
VGYREYLEGLNVEVSDQESRKVRWKIDLIVLPIFLVTQALQFMDRTALNYANLFGYQQALGLKGQQFNYLSASKGSPEYEPRGLVLMLCQLYMLDISLGNILAVGSLAGTLRNGSFPWLRSSGA